MKNQVFLGVILKNINLKIHSNKILKAVFLNYIEEKIKTLKKC